MSKLGKLLLFSVVFEATFAALYVGHAADSLMNAISSPLGSQSIHNNLGNSTNGANNVAGGATLLQFVSILFSNPLALGIIWSAANATIIAWIVLKSYHHNSW